MSNSLSLTQYLQLSPGIFSLAAHEPIDAYFEPLIGNSTAVDVAQAMAYGDGFTNYFMPFLSGLITEDNTTIVANEQAVHQTMNYMVDHAPDLSNKIGTTLNLADLYGGMTADNFTQFLTANGGSIFMEALGNEKKDSSEMVNFISNMIADNTIINATWLAANGDAAHALTNAVSNIADRTNASLFFNDWLTQRNNKWLPDNTGLEERLNVVYQNDRTNFLTGYLNNIGLGEVNRALEHIPHMTTGLYLNFIWEGVLHGSLNPSYSPPQVNTPDPNNIDKDTLYLAEHHLYGSSRLGIKTYETEPRLRVVFERTAGQTVGTVIENTLTAQTSWFSAGYADWIRKDRTGPFNGSTYNRTVDLLRNVRILGSKQYELSDHLGNVLATVLDKKTGYGNTIGLYNGYYANLASVTDYYPFGMQMPGRNKSYSEFRMGFNGKEKDDEVYGEGNFQDYGMRMYMPQIARFFAVDPLTSEYPWYTPYQFAGNKPIQYVDLDGAEETLYGLAQVGAFVKTGSKIVIGTVDGIHASLSNTWSFVSSDMWKAKTWKNLAKFTEQSAMSMSTVKVINTPMVDAAVQNFNQNVVYGDAYSRSKFVAQLATDIATGYVGSKGIGLISKGLGMAFEMPKLRTLTNLQAREWYLTQEAKIESVVAKNPGGLEAQAKQAFNLRNAVRTFSRELMADRKTAEALYIENPNLTWDQVYKKYNGDYNKIIEASTRSRASVNEALGVKPPEKKQ